MRCQAPSQIPLGSIPLLAGKAFDSHQMFSGHTGPGLDTAFSASCSGPGRASAPWLGTPGFALPGWYSGPGSPCLLTSRPFPQRRGAPGPPSTHYLIRVAVLTLRTKGHISGLYLRMRQLWSTWREGGAEGQQGTLPVLLLTLLKSPPSEPKPALELQSPQEL